MMINKKYYIAKENGTNTITTNLFDGKRHTIYVGDANYGKFNDILKAMRKRNDSTAQKNKRMALILDNMGISSDDMDQYLMEVVVDPTLPTEDEKNLITAACDKMIDFFSEFGVDVSMRFINTFCRVKNPAKFTVDYFTVCNHSSARMIADKTKSAEFMNLVDTLSGKARKVINSRLKIYYGAPGTGKTTKAMGESDTTIICRCDMVPKDIMQDFDFVNGQATFKKSAFWLAMENGGTVTLDEINLLPYDTLRFMQGLLDGKEVVEYLGQTINIHPDFKVIGTMNLMVDGQPYGLPEPLVDRCSDIQEFKMTGKFLANAIF